MANKLKGSAKKVGRSLYMRLPWHTKLLVPVVVITALLFGVEWVAGLVI